MEEIRCPMCSKMNPAENEECQYCSARLKPLAAPPFDSGGPADVNPARDEVPEWINRLADFGGFASEESGKPDSQETAPQDPPASSGSASDDWLARLQDDIRKAEQDQPAESPKPADPGESLPDWLKNVREAASRDLTEPPLGLPVFEAESGSQDDWLERLRTQKKEQAEEKPFIDNIDTPAPKVPPEEPDWLHAFPHQKEESSSGTGTPSSELPDWLSAGQHSGGNVLSDWSSGGQAAEPADIPDWLGNETPSRPAPSVPAQDQPASVEGTGSEAQGLEKPDWLVELESRAPQVSTQAQPGPVLSFDQPAGGEAERITDNMVGEELPDWLANFGPAVAQGPVIEPPVAQPSEQHDDIDLAPADLPGWLRAMRPIETVAPSPAVRRESDQREEKSGPLAGLRGTLPSEPSLGGIQRPPSYIARLQPTENQERYRAIFEELVANEKEPQPARVIRLISSQRMIRMAIGLLLLAAVLIPAVTGLSLLPLPALLPQETLDMQAAVAALPADSPVLVAVEYEPSLAGEMESAAAGVIDHLMQQDARLAFISTTPTGPALANRLVEQVLSRPEAYHDAYTDGQKLAILGYLAGGPAGLMDFALRPQAAAPVLQDGTANAWQQPALAGVTNLSDFGLILLITDDQQSGRSWLEQIQPRTGTNAPLLVVSSAQAAPVLASYLDGRQVDGMLSGLAGGTIYEQLQQRDGPGTGRWQAFQLVMAVSLAAILIGAAADLIMEYLASRKANAEA